MATFIEKLETSTTFNGLVMVPDGSHNVTSRSIQSSRNGGEVHGKILVLLLTSLRLSMSTNSLRFMLLLLWWKFGFAAACREA